MPPGVITKRLGMKPRFKWTAGSVRRTPRGALLRSADGKLLGVNRESYWCGDVVRYRIGRCGKSSAAEAQIEKFCRKLVRHAGFFKHIWEEGGHVWLWVDSHSTLNYTFVLSPTCLDLLASASVALVIDVYPNPQNFGRAAPPRRRRTARHSRLATTPRRR